MICTIPDCETPTGRPNKGRPPKYCPAHRASRNGARTMARATGGTLFIGVDGEGWTDELGEHRYAQLSVGSRTLFGAEHLDCLDVFAFLWSCYEEAPRAAYVGFYLGYDFSQWFRTLPEHVAASLLGSDGIAARRRKMSGGNTVPFPVRYRGWEFDILGNKRFKLRRTGSESWMYICDCGPFFQSSFMAVIDPKKWPGGSPITDHEHTVIAEGKSKRADYSTAAQWWAAEEELTRYNVYENQALAKIMGTYEEGLTAVGVHLERDQWYGPGQAAQAWMDNIELIKRADLERVIPEPVFDFARQSYYGGRFEVFAHGHIPGAAYEYDINSAYPAAMAVMPAWEECEFEWRSESSALARGEDIWTPGTGLALLDCTTAGTNAVATGFPHREKNGRILFPRKTRGVRWSFEIEAAMAAGLVSTVDVHRALVITAGAGSVLNREIPLIYQQRLDVGKESSAGKAMKLIYNSAYGKQAQSVGSPKFSNPLSASFITAQCRASIMMAIATHPNGSSDLLMIATDGVYFRSPHPTLRLSETELGQWSQSTKSNMTITMPGVYYDDKARRSLGLPSPQVIDCGPGCRWAELLLDLDGVQNKQWAWLCECGRHNGWHPSPGLRGVRGSDPTGDSGAAPLRQSAVREPGAPITGDQAGQREGSGGEEPWTSGQEIWAQHQNTAAWALVTETAPSAGGVTVKSRGIPPAAFAASIGRLDVAFSTLANDPAVSESWPVLDVPIKFKVKTPKAALNEGKWGRAGTVERDVDRKLSTDPSLKRQGPASPQLALFGDPSGLPYVDRGVVRTVPYEQGAVLQSAPYSKSFGIKSDDDGWGFGPDGDLQGDLLDLLKGNV